MDRDGVITKDAIIKDVEDFTSFNFITSIKQINLISGSAEAIARLNMASVPVIIVTNQPVIARGLCSVEDLNKIHEHLFSLLSCKSAHIDGLYYCPHHPVYGIGDYKKDCDCRKPKPGLILKAAADHNIDLSKSYMVGDKTSDIMAGQLAGCKTIGVNTGYACNDGSHNVTPDMFANDLNNAVDLILKGGVE